MKLTDLLRNAQPTKVSWVRRPEILLCLQTPKPLHEVCPRIILGKKWWDETRQKAYESTGYHCVACGVHKYLAQMHQWLEGHEVYKIDYRRGRMTYVETVPLCHFCHAYIHRGRLDALLSKDQISGALHDAIIGHGDSVLHVAKIKKKPLYSGTVADWHKWRLILEGKEYPPKYKSFEEWCAKWDVSMEE